jgi:hypothetical protein
MAESNITIEKAFDPKTGTFENTEQAKLARNAGLVSSLRAAWGLVQHASPFQIRLYLSTLRHSQLVCVHLTEEIDELIRMVEARLKEIDSLDRDVRTWEKSITGPRA